MALTRNGVEEVLATLRHRVVPWGCVVAVVGLTSAWGPASNGNTNLSPYEGVGLASGREVLHRHLASSQPSQHDRSGPGPEILYRPLASSPQLANARPWEADPILVSGTSAYRKGEFLYQDYLYDDYGADGGIEPPEHPDPYKRRGSYLYPTDPGYAGNAADLVELRVKPLADATAFRITYNTMHDPALVATTIALGTSAVAFEMPHGANARAPARVFATVHGSAADVVHAATGEQLPGVKPRVAVSLERRQVELRIPHAAFDPRGRVVRVAAASGLWDVVNDRYLLPRSGAADATYPGGAGRLNDPTAFFNVAFRYDEPGIDLACTMEAFACSYWREQRQATALAAGDLSGFFANVHFAKLAEGTSDDLRGQPQGIPESGFISRILVSHFESAQGRGDASWLGPEVPWLEQPGCTELTCIPDLAGRLQPYGIYLPAQPPPQSGYGLTLDLHGSGGNHNGASDLPYISQLSERGRGSIVAFPGGRGPSYWYFGQAAADVFEVWADVAARYNVNSDNVAITGMSMGGYGAYKLAALFPDLFVAAAPVIPCTFDPATLPNLAILPLVRSYRHVPVFSWNMREDEACAYTSARAVGDRLTTLGYRNEFLSAHGGHGDGLYAAIVDFSEVADWLDERVAERNPVRVTYVLSEYMNEPELGLTTDHAYWLSNLRLRDDSATPPVGTIDVFSHGSGFGDAPPRPTTVSEGVVDATPPLAFVKESTELGPAPSIPRRDRLDITAENIAVVTIGVDRARVSCDAELNVSSDGPITVTLQGGYSPGETIAFGSQDSGVPNYLRGDGRCTFLDRVFAEGPFANHGVFMRTVRSLIREWRSDGQITRQEAQAVQRAAGRSGIGLGGPDR